MIIETLSNGSVTQQAIGRLLVQTRGAGFADITAPLARWVLNTGILTGLATIFCRHTSASLTIQENADPDVLTDLRTSLDRLAPRGAGYVHGIEGPDDMPAHIKTMLTSTSVAIPVLEGQLALGQWQGVYLVEHRDRPHRREILVHLTGA
jgi:secondary thiamine-phosphate synthase enzyme